MRDRSDPVTGESYVYRLHHGADYELCATFSRASDNDGPGFGDENTRWRHEAGEQCFALSAQDIELAAAEAPPSHVEVQPVEQ